MGLFLLALPASAYVIETPPQIEDYIIYKAENEGVPVSLALAIAKAESGLIYTAHNPTSTASGIAQFLDSTWIRYCVNKYHIATSLRQKEHPALQINCMIEILAQEKDGWKNWEASKFLWIKNVVDPKPYILLARSA